ncbi:hypothetical protein GMRT_15247 [Giardia muris]|uniref:Uncharacterized protein n=1 Tax=Giardia muris TaxID=5742 RepID=A0A4Z1T6Q9_GIAMU|nr:hypothetical protein GMRT_15247 [Giardia muris]|eukprot:TNJ28171.1 hypothetical protein GMRT_15247 [Giardia muris]
MDQYDQRSRPVESQYQRSSIFFSTVSDPRDFILGRPDPSASDLVGWKRGEVLATYKRADDYRLTFEFPAPLYVTKTIPIDRIPARQIDVNPDGYVYIRDLDTEASFASIEDLREWVENKMAQPKGELISFRLSPGQKLRFRALYFFAADVPKCALTIIGPTQ